MPIDATAVQKLPNVLCIDKCTPVGRQLAVLIALAAQWGGLSLNPAILQANGACFDRCIPPGMRMGVLVSLAEQIAVGGSAVSPTSCSYTPVNTEVSSFIAVECQISTGVCKITGNLPVAKALDDMVTALKAAGVWSRFDAIYPFVGGTAASCALNLVNPAAYQITWNGGVTFPVGGGVKGDGATGYGDTGFNPTTAVGANYTQNSASMGVITGDPAANTGPLIGASNGSALSINASVEINGAVFGINGEQIFGLVPTGYQGLFAATSNGATARSAYIQVNQIQNYNLTLAEGLPNANFFLLHTVGAATGSKFSGQTLKLAFIGGGFSGAEIAAINTAATAFVNTPSIPGCP